MILHSKFYILHSHRGQAVLSSVFVIGGTIVLIGLALSFLATSFVNSAYAFQASERAEAVALSGIYDALQRLNRSSAPASPASVSTGSGSATVTIAQNSPATGEVTITSSAAVSNRRRVFRAVVSVATSTGQASVVSLSAQ